MLKNAGFVLVVILGVGIWAFLNKPSKSNPVSQTATGTFSGSPSTTQSQLNEPANPLEKKLHHEASLIGRPDASPEDTEERLQTWAQALSTDELEQLKVTALNTRKPQDDRFLAVMLMAWSKKVEALENLKDIALSEIDPFLSPNRMGDFERILRMQAVDSMIDLPASGQNIENTLKTIATQARESSTADRAHRALWAYRGDAAIPPEQDRAALETLLKKSKRN